MHKRHLYEMHGKIEPKSGLLVRAYKKPINFEWQVEQHMKSWRSQLKDRPEWPTDAKAEERSIRLRLAVGQSWLNIEPQKDLF